jgi:N-acyl-L-homoserine lactone synthetase
MNDSLVDEPLPSSSTVVAGSFLRKLQLRMQKLLQRTTVSFPRRIVDNHVAADRAGHGRDEDGECLLQRCFDCSSERIEVPANQVLQIHWDVDLRCKRAVD